MTPLIPYSYLNDACFLSLNTDDKKYKICLSMSQDKLKDILGRSFYAEIESQYPSSFTTANQTLYNYYLKDFLAWQTYLNYLKFANVEATPTGIRQFDDENSTVADDIKMFSLEKNVKAEALKKENAITNFLNESRLNDSTSYPLWVDRCKKQFGFAITSVDANSDIMIRVNKSITSQE